MVSERDLQRRSDPLVRGVAVRIGAGNLHLRQHGTVLAIAMAEWASEPIYPYSVPCDCSSSKRNDEK